MGVGNVVRAAPRRGPGPATRPTRYGEAARPIDGHRGGRRRRRPRCPARPPARRRAAHRRTSPRRGPGRRRAPGARRRPPPRPSPRSASVVNSAPRLRTNSSSVARARPVTCHPRSGANASDVPADGPRRPGHQQTVAVDRRITEQVDDLRRCEPVERHGRRGDEVQFVGHDSDVARGHDDLLGVRAEVAVEALHHAGHPGADRQLHAISGCDDLAGEVPAEPGPLGLIDQPQSVEDAPGDGEIDRVHRRGNDRDPDLARLRARRLARR